MYNISSSFKFQQMLRLKISHALQSAEEKTKQATGFLLKFEKAQETMEEAKLMLQALLKTNEDAKFERHQWITRKPRVAGRENYTGCRIALT